MTLIMSLLVCVLVTAGILLLMRKNLFEVILGIALLSQAVNVTLVTAGGWEALSRPPIIVEAPVVEQLEDGTVVKTSRVETVHYADPLPQALILTAIVIGFAILSFLIVLVARGYELHGALDFGEHDEDGPPE